jgi:hypothetical protein
MSTLNCSECAPLSYSRFGAGPKGKIQRNMILHSAEVEKGKPHFTNSIKVFFRIWNLTAFFRALKLAAKQTRCAARFATFCRYKADAAADVAALARVVRHIIQN